MADNNRNVSKTEISRSFKGILRVSPDDTGADVGITIVPKNINDSDGNPSAIAIGTESITVTNEVVNRSHIVEQITIGNNTNIPVSTPKQDDMLVGDGKNNYTLQNFKNLFDKYIAENNIIEQGVPVGTIMPIAVNSMDISNLPVRYQEYYDFAIGQRNNTLSGKEYNNVNYPDLFKLINGSYSNMFTSLSLNLNPTTEQYFSQSKPTVNAIKIDTSPTTGSFAYKASGEIMLFKNIGVIDKNYVYQSNQQVDVTFTQPALNVSIDVSTIPTNQLKRYYFYYLPAGTRVTARGISVTTKSTGEVRNNPITLGYCGYSGAGGDFDITSTLLGATTQQVWTIPKSDIYCIAFPYNSNASETTFESINYKPYLQFTTPLVTPVIQLGFNTSKQAILSSEDLQKISTFLYFTKSLDYLHNYNYDYNMSLYVNDIETPFDNLITHFSKTNLETGDTSTIKTGVNCSLKFILPNSSTNEPVINQKITFRCSTLPFIYEYNRYSSDYAFTSSPAHAMFLKAGTTVSGVGWRGTANGIPLSQGIVIAKDYPNNRIIPFTMDLNYTISEDGYYYINVPSNLAGPNTPYQTTQYATLRVNQTQNAEWFPTSSLPENGMVTGLKFETIASSSGSATTPFNLPDLRNKFIRGASKESIQVSSPEGNYVIPAHLPFAYELPQTNYGGISGRAAVNGWFTSTSVRDANINNIAGGAFRCSELYPTVITGVGGGWFSQKIELNATIDIGNTTPKETRPNNISLAYLIKIK